jgi:hypothetical protein
MRSREPNASAGASGPTRHPASRKERSCVRRSPHGWPKSPGPFHGEPRREGGSWVKPITLPDGTTAEIVYPTRLKLGKDYVSPGAYVKGAWPECHPEIHFTASRVVGTWASRGPPLAVFEGMNGDSVALWSGKRWLRPWDVLAFDFGDCVGMLYCRAGSHDDAARLSTLARSLDGYTTPDGLLVLAPGPPVRLVEEGLQVGRGSLWRTRIHLSLRLSSNCPGAPHQQACWSLAGLLSASGRSYR